MPDPTYGNPPLPKGGSGDFLGLESPPTPLFQRGEQYDRTWRVVAGSCRTNRFLGAVRRLILSVPSLLLLLTLTNCGGDPGTGAVDVKWDRTACERCRMVLSDRKHSAQIRISEPDRRSRVYLFDDIGCAVIWLQDTPYEKDPSTEIWVTDWQSGDWIDATTSTFLTGQVTPMEYGLGAQQAPAKGGLDYEQAKAHILDVERRFNVHGGHLDAPPSAK